MVMIEGHIFHHEHGWTIHLPLLCAFVPGKTRKKALLAAQEFVERAVGLQEFKAQSALVSRTAMTLSSNNESALMALILRMQRQAVGPGWEQATKRMGEKTAKSYARNARRRSRVQVEKFMGLMKAIGSDVCIVLRGEY